MIDYEYLKNRVKQKLELEPTGHDYAHALRVLNNSEIISKAHSVNQDVIRISCLVHDLIDDKLESKYKLSLDELEQLLIDCHCSKNTMNTVFDIINRMSYRKKERFDSLEGQFVQDADRLDALGAIGIARTFVFGGSHKRRIVDNKNNAETSVGHFYDKLFKLTDLMNTDTAKLEAKRRTKYMKQFVDELKRETGIQSFRNEGD